MQSNLLKQARVGSALILAGILCTFGGAEAQAKKAKAPKQVVPVIQSITIDQTGQLVASGTATAIVNGRTHTAPFSGVPVNISLAQVQPVGAACPVLDLELGPINLNLLGLVLETSPICLQITAYEGGGLLGDLLCSVANLLNGGLSQQQILAGQGIVDPTTGLTLVPGLTPSQLGGLLSGVQNLLNSALQRLLDAVLSAIEAGANCDVLRLELGPLELTLLGLEVILDDCNGGPVVVDIEGQPGALLGDLLCGLAGLTIDLTTLQNILDRLLGGL